ncbi:MAG: tetratricopeptide repeat protein [Chitinivibrionales bacterium]|nr:tetratricopeptide repeat protein [Chitinivibrionales bacterium]
MIRTNLHRYILPAIAAALLWLQCAGTLMTVNERMLASADSLFYNGDYTNAKRTYAKLRSSFPNTPQAEEAQYKLGYINIYYKNHFGDREEAIKEFNRYQSKYPNGDYIEEVNNWLNIILAITDYEEGYYSSVKTADTLLNRKKDFEKTSDFLKKEYQRCNAARDSLAKELDTIKHKLSAYEEIIDKLHKEP